MNWSEIATQWSAPAALISAIIALIVALMNRRMPFQQKLNEAQIAEVKELWMRMVVSDRERKELLRKETFAYATACQTPNYAPENLELVRKEFFNNFLHPDIIGPAHEISMSIVLPSSVDEAVGRYQDSVSFLVVEMFTNVEKHGGDYAWQIASQRLEVAITELKDAIRTSLCINELTAENERAAGVGMFATWRRRKAKQRLVAQETLGDSEAIAKAVQRRYTEAWLSPPIEQDENSERIERKGS